MFLHFHLGYFRHRLFKVDFLVLLLRATGHHHRVWLNKFQIFDRLFRNFLFLLTFFLLFLLQGVIVFVFKTRSNRGIDLGSAEDLCEGRKGHGESREGFRVVFNRI
jgi:magnesium-transporting ATPase (P-type)